jgi:glycine/D-amino acid oxidase-like deaminating enzyme
MIPPGMRERFPLALHFPDHRALQPARWVRALVAGAAEHGAEVFDGSPVVGIEEGEHGWIVHTPGGSLTAQAVVVAADGLIPRILPGLGGAVYPVRGQLVATAAVPREALPCPTGALHGFIYGQQLASGEVVLGGFRHVDLEAEYTDEPAVTPPVQAALDAFLHNEIGLEGVPVTHRWAGIMGFSADLLPLAGELPDRPGLFVCGGYSGAGNVLGHLCGGLVADLIATGAHPYAAVFDPARFAAGVPEPLEKTGNRKLVAELAG